MIEVRCNPGEEVCDFCSSKDNSWLVMTKPFSLGPLMSFSADWAACEKCATLIQAGDWAGLKKRAVDSLPKLGIPGRNEYLTALHTRIRSNFISVAKEIQL